jgi:hypothetical protein
MISFEVQRTLVKSPPELWAELSDPTALSRHLQLPGEVRVTRVEPERTLEWEAQDASGKVELAPSGWGTKVRLSLTREAPEASSSETSPSEPAASQADDRDDAPTAHDRTASTARRRRRLGVIFRLLWRKRSDEADSTPPRAAKSRGPALDCAQEPDLPQPDLAAEPRADEEELAAAGTTLLNGVLDSLGAAHHRPFSRS